MSSFQSDCVVQQSLYLFYTKFRVPKLYRYVDQGKWHKIPSRCMRYPHEAHFVHRYPPYDTALHRLLRTPDVRSTEYKQFLVNLDPEIKAEMNQLRIKAILALIQANPSIVSITDWFGQTPLHLACINAECTKGTAEILLDAYPKAALIQDKSGKTPLHYLQSGDTLFHPG